LELIENKVAEEPKKVLVEPRLMVRESSLRRPVN
jgi:hypothetical protein